MSMETEKNPKISPRDMQRVMSSAEGKELLSLLSQNGGLQKAMEAFRRGDMKGVREALEPAMATEKAEELLQKINGK